MPVSATGKCRMLTFSSPKRARSSDQTGTWQAIRARVRERREAAGETSSGFVARFLAQAEISWRHARQEIGRRRSFVRKDLRSARHFLAFLAHGGLFLAFSPQARQETAVPRRFVRDGVGVCATKWSEARTASERTNVGQTFLSAFVGQTFLSAFQ